MPDCVIFDLDSTLAKSKQPVDADMARTLTKLLTYTHVAITSGGMLEQLITQVVDQLPPDAALERLYLLPTSGAALYAFVHDEWTCIYEETLTDAEAAAISDAIHAANAKTHTIDFSTPAYGERIEFRGAQVSLSALGQHAPLEAKRTWDPDRTKRIALRAALMPLLPAYEVRIGGTTTIDITKKGIDKAYGVRELANELSLPVTRMLYVGDELAEGGNDAVVIQTGIHTHAVTNPTDTSTFIASLIAAT